LVAAQAQLNPLLSHSSLLLTTLKSYSYDKAYWKKKYPKPKFMLYSQLFFASTKTEVASILLKAGKERIRDCLLDINAIGPELYFYEATRKNGCCFLRLLLSIACMNDSTGSFFKAIYFVKQKPALFITKLKPGAGRLLYGYAT
jgi:hypothetical protein